PPTVRRRSRRPGLCAARAVDRRGVAVRHLSLCSIELVTAPPAGLRHVWDMTRWSLVVMATRLDLGPSRGLTSSFAGRPGACPMRGASLRALAPGQAVSP